MLLKSLRFHLTNRFFHKNDSAVICYYIVLIFKYIIYEQFRFKSHATVYQVDSKYIYGRFCQLICLMQAPPPIFLMNLESHLNFLDLQFCVM